MSLGAALLSNQGRSKCSHNACNIRPHCRAARKQFEGAQDCVVVKCSTLHNDLLTQLMWLPDLDHLKESIFHHRIRQSGRDIANASSFFLGLLDPGVHKHGAAGSQIHGTLCCEGLCGKRFYSHIQRLSKSLQERSAARRTCFVQEHVFDDSIPDTHAFHILAAYVQHKVDTGAEEVCPFVVGDCLNLTEIHPQSSLDQPFSIAGYRCIPQYSPSWDSGIERLKGICNCLQGAAVVAAVM